jgi:hypothetical protein
MSEKFSLSELEAAATPGPWRWAGYIRDLMVTTVDRGMIYVMGFKRSGLQGAQPTFQVPPGGHEWGGRGGVMKPGSELAVREVPYRDHVVDIDHPDARLFVVARNSFPLFLRLRTTATELVEMLDWTPQELADALKAIDDFEADLDERLSRRWSA